jgi:hypothetical protein
VVDERNFQKNRRRTFKVKKEKEKKKKKIPFIIILFVRYVFVCSASGIGLRHNHQPLFTLLDRLFYLDEQNYPNSVSSYFVIQTPWLFSLLKVTFHFIFIIYLFIYVKTKS